MPIGGVIRGSAVEKLLAASNGAFGGFDQDELRLAMLDPDDIADVFWNLQHTRDRAEQVVGG